MRSEQVVRTVPATGSIFPGRKWSSARKSAAIASPPCWWTWARALKKGRAAGASCPTTCCRQIVASRQAALRSAEASEVNAAAALRRGEQVSTSGALSAADLDRLKAEQVAAHARVDTARVDLHTAELRLRYSTVAAPDSGTITSRTVSVGQIAQAGQEMLRLLRQNRVEWRAEVPESLLSHVKAGQNVQITAVDGSTLKGKDAHGCAHRADQQPHRHRLRGHHQRQRTPRHVCAWRHRGRRCTRHCWCPSPAW